MPRRIFEEHESSLKGLVYEGDRELGPLRQDYRAYVARARLHAVARKMRSSRWANPETSRNRAQAAQNSAETLLAAGRLREAAGGYLLAGMTFWESGMGDVRPKERQESFSSSRKASRQAFRHGATLFDAAPSVAVQVFLSRAVRQAYLAGLELDPETAHQEFYPAGQYGLAAIVDMRHPHDVVVYRDLEHDQVRSNVGLSFPDSDQAVRE